MLRIIVSLILTVLIVYEIKKITVLRAPGLFVLSGISITTLVLYNWVFVGSLLLIIISSIVTLLNLYITHHLALGTWNDPRNYVIIEKDK